MALMQGRKANGDISDVRLDEEGALKVDVALNVETLEVGEVLAGLDEQGTANAMATAPAGSPAAGSVTALLAALAASLPPSASAIATAINNAIRASAVPVSGTVSVANPPDNPPSASAIATAIDEALRDTPLGVSFGEGAISVELGDAQIEAGLDEQGMADALATAPSGSAAEGSVTALLAAIAASLPPSASAVATAINTALRATALPVSGTVTMANPPDSPPSALAIAAAIDAALRDSALGVSGTVTVANPPSSPPTASAIGNDLRGGAKIPTNILMGIGAARSVAAGSTSARVQLSSSGIVGVSVTAVGADVYFALGNGTVTASSASHFLPEGQSRDFRVSASQYIAAIRAGEADGTLHITELQA